MALLTKDIMTTKVVTVGPDINLLELESILRKSKIGGAPVVKGGKLIGIVSRSDIARQLTVEDTYAQLAHDMFESVYGHEEDRAENVGEQIGERLAESHVRDAMLSSVETVGPDEPVAELARKMLAHRHRRMVVVDEQQRILGIVTTSDLVRLIADGRMTEA